MAEYAATSPHPLPAQSRQLSVRNWVITRIIAAIPVVNLIMLFVWALGSETAREKSNWAIASLILIALVPGLYVALAVLFVFLGVGSGFLLD